MIVEDNVVKKKKHYKPLPNKNTIILLSNDTFFINSQRALITKTTGMQSKIFKTPEEVHSKLNKKNYTHCVGVIIYYPELELHCLLDMFQQFRINLNVKLLDKINFVLVLSRKKVYYLDQDYSFQSLTNLHLTYAPIHAKKLKFIF